MSEQTLSPKINTGFIGLGNQGTPIAARMLQAGYPVTVWARRPEVADAFAQQGAVAVGSIAELGALCDHVGICVFADQDVIDVCDQLIPAMSVGSVIAVHSTIHPDVCETLSRKCAERGLLFLDAPVSGGALVAEQGALTVMCGGEAEAFERARPVFESFGKLIVHLGEVGAGQRAKIINNALMSANMGAARAAMAAGKTLGLDKAALAEVINNSSGRSLGFQVYAGMRTYLDFSVGTLAMVKDVALLHAMLGDENSETLRSTADFFLKPAAEALKG